MEPFIFSGSVERFSLTDATVILESLLKIMFLVAFVLFFAFAFVVVRQVKLMSATIRTPLEGILMLLSYAYLLVTGGILLFAFFAL